MANDSIGTSPCPVGECMEIMKVYKFKAHETGRRSAFSGKLYGICPTHGAFGRDGAKGANEWLLENATITGSPPATDEPENRPMPRKNPDSAGPQTGRLPMRSGLLID